MSHDYDMPEPPPIDYDDYGYIPDHDPFDDLPPLPLEHETAKADMPSDDGWSWHDARIVGVDRGAEAGAGRYEIGVINLYADTHTGDLGGSYLPITAFEDETPANDFYHGLQAQIHDQGLAPYQVPEFGEARAFEAVPEPENWRGATIDEYRAYEYLRDLEAFDPNRADEPPQQALDPLMQTITDLGGVIVEIETEVAPAVDESAFQALNAIGVQADTLDPPPFYDAQTGTAYWIGVFQPAKDDHENCLTSILSLGRNPETGTMEAQLAPCVSGDWDKAYRSAEYLLQVADRGGIEQVFDTAEGMALATEQRELWENERGVTLEPDVAQNIADYAREQWEIDL